MSARRSLTRLALAPSVSIVAALLLVPSVAAAEQTITSEGPLTEIIISDELNCQVAHAEDEDFEFYDPDERVGACGTFVAADGVLYSPSEVPAGSDAVGTPYTPVSQSAVTGTGTAGDPYRLVTVVALGETGLTITQTDSYVVGNEYYRTDVAIALASNANADIDIILYRAGDCYLQESDDGFGSVDAASGAVRCVAPEDPENPEAGPGDESRIEEWVPLTGGSAYYEAEYETVWERIGDMEPFPNTCECDEYQDNGAGLSWELTVEAGSSVTASHLTNFSPEGVSAVPTPAPTPAPTTCPPATSPTAAPTGTAAPTATAPPTASASVAPTGTVAPTASASVAPTGTVAPTATAGILPPLVTGDSDTVELAFYVFPAQATDPAPSCPATAAPTATPRGGELPDTAGTWVRAMGPWVSLLILVGSLLILTAGRFGWKAPRKRA